MRRLGQAAGLGAGAGLGLEAGQAGQAGQGGACHCRHLHMGLVEQGMSTASISVHYTVQKTLHITCLPIKTCIDISLPLTLKAPRRVIYDPPNSYL